MTHKNIIKVILLAAAFVAGGTLTLKAASVNYVGPGADLADPSNWSGSWTSADTLVISTTNNATFPEGGFTLSGDMPSSAKIHMTRFPASPVKVECGGHSLNTEILDCGVLHVEDSKRSIPVTLSGGFNGVTKIATSGNRDCIHLTNGVFKVANGYFSDSWFGSLYVLKGAELVITNIVNDYSKCGFGWNSFDPVCDIDGGRLRIMDRSASTEYTLGGYLRFGWIGRKDHDGVLKIRNGGEYVDDSGLPQDYFYCFNVLIDGGSYIATNVSSIARRNLLWLGAASNSTKSRFFAVTNGNVKIAQFSTGDLGFNEGINGCHELTDYAKRTRITFHNSQEIFGSGRVSTFIWEGRMLNACDGMFFARKAEENSLLISGSENVYRSGWFVLGGATNTVEVAGGSFSVTNRFCAYDGYDSAVRFTGGVSDIESFHVTGGATNFTVEVSGDAAVNIAELSLARETKFRFVVPEEGFDKAPVKCGTTSADGNLRFEIDMSSFTWPDSVSMIPLVYDEGGFAEWGGGGASLDIAALNAAYAESLPVGPGGRKCHFKLVENGKMLSLAIPNGLILYVR